MAESSLSAAYNDLAGDVGAFLGWGRGAANSDQAWTTQQQAVIDRCIKGGMRKVYFCGHDWSFLKPVATLAIDSGARTVQLPDDYGGADGQITVSAATTIVWYPVNLSGIGQLYHQQALSPTTTGRPQLAAEEPLKGTTGTRGQRFQLRLWPQADAAYSLTFAYWINPDYLNGGQPYLYGGPQHAETFLAACKACAELDNDDEDGGPQGREFLRLLEASQDIDRRGKAAHFGYNADRSNQAGRAGWRNQHGDALITVRGVQY